MLFSALPNQWVPALHAAKLRAAPQQVWLAGERLVLFRGEGGQPKALLDRCPHRGVALSLGRVTTEGHLECPFHGWQFRGDGACQRVPLEPEARCEKLSVAAFPVVEKGGLIWVFTGEESARPSLEPDVPEALLHPSAARADQEVLWRCHWTRAMENMLDYPHLPWVHAGTIGRGLPKDGRLTLTITDLPTGFHLDWSHSSAPSEGGLEWWRPCGMMLDIGGGTRLFRQHVFCVPGREGETRMMISTVRDFGWLGNLLSTPFMGWAERKILLEDQRVVESSEPAEAPPASEERSVRNDAPTLRFRAWYYLNVRPERLVRRPKEAS